MDKIGPELEVLTHRLAETPREFLEEPRINNNGTVHVAALVNDLFKMYGTRLNYSILTRFESVNAKQDRNRLALVMIAVWLLADHWFVSVKPTQQYLINVLDDLIAELSATTPAHKFVTDPDRREELARLTLARLTYRPAGETVLQATDRLSSISGAERRRLLEASRAAEERARAIRETLAKKAAEESADKWTRE